MKRRALGILGMAGLVGCGGAAPAIEAPSVASTHEEAKVGYPSEAPKPARCARRRAGAGAAPIGGDRQGSAAALARIGGRTIAYTADGDDDAIHTFDVDRAEQIAVTPIAGSPSQILVLAD